MLSCSMFRDSAVVRVCARAPFRQHASCRTRAAPRFFRDGRSGMSGFNLDFLYYSCRGRRAFHRGLDGAQGAACLSLDGASVLLRHCVGSGPRRRYAGANACSHACIRCACVRGRRASDAISHSSDSRRVTHDGAGGPSRRGRSASLHGSACGRATDTVSADSGGGGGGAGGRRSLCR